ncbi:hypothetical protein [Engelhardtia mirabilis]|uniref:Uncharacterized protein n=1 Tax=Engelhardtia mirabilis TaxID=2528011 RepID=A0A518BFV4_9BACT|nr:hypothetical protein Pla133_09180 [Planctomycetes bacterium Pla133]QDV00178.1 hypothetical protein Pla86_09170 [Planctomycetes bacterium Pla86]
MTAPPRALLYLAADLEDRPRLLAAIERDPAADAGIYLLPDSSRISERDVRGRRAPLGALLSPLAASNESALADVAAHLLPLPELGAEPVPRIVDLRLIGLAASAFDAHWPAPGGGQFEVRSAAFALPGRREGAVLASRGAPHGPWLRPIGAVAPEVSALLALLAELGIQHSGPALFENWLSAPARDGMHFEPEDASEIVDGLRALLREEVLGDGSGPREVRGCQMSISTETDGAHLRWRIELRRGDDRRLLEHTTARYSPDAVAELLAVVDARLQPYWLLVFDRVEGLGASFVGLVELRRFLVENLDQLEGALP